MTAFQSMPLGWAEAHPPPRGSWDFDSSMAAAIAASMEGEAALYQPHLRDDQVAYISLFDGHLQETSRHRRLTRMDPHLLFCRGHESDVADRHAMDAEESASRNRSGRRSCDPERQGPLEAL